MRLKIFPLLIIAMACHGMASAQTVTAMNEGIVPVVIRAPGLNDSTWTTSAYLTQVSGQTPAQVTLNVVNPNGESWSSTVTLPAARGATAINDVISSVDASIPDGKYIMTWWSTEPILLTTRTFTSEATGSYGQGIASLSPGSGFATNDQVIFPAPMDFAGHRVNVGIANTGLADQSFAIEAVDAAGASVKTWSRTVAPGSVLQLQTNEQLTAAGSVAVRCTAGCDGTAFAYASVVVNDSNDAYFLYAGAAAAETGFPPVATIRDERGVFHITGGSFYDVFEAMGYAVATDRLWQSETFRRQARGTLSEIFGPDFLDSDVFMRATGYSETELQRELARVGSKEKLMMRAYVAGFNRRIAEVTADPSLLPFEFHAVGQSLLGQPLFPAPWTVTDILAWGSVLQRNFDAEAYSNGLVMNAELFQALAAAFPTEYPMMFTDLRWLNDPSAQTMIPHEDPAQQAVPAMPRLVVEAMPDMRGLGRRMAAARNARVEMMQRINAHIKMGSYAWVVSGDKTASGNPILYSGPQMGFTTPAPLLEGSIRGGGLNISGMTIAGLPGFIVGRTPHHAWSSQVGHAHTVDLYMESAANVSLHRMETISVAGSSDVVVPVFRSPHGPIVEPIPFDPTSPPATILAWKYSHWGYEAEMVSFALGVMQATSMEEFGEAATKVPISLHFCYADRDGNIAYWMSGRDPVRPDGIETRLPLPGDGTAEWDAAVIKPFPHDSNPAQGFYGGWNNKSELTYNNAPNCFPYSLGPAHRAHVVMDYLQTHDNLTYEQVRDLAINIAATDSFGHGGNPWKFVGDRFSAAVQAYPTAERTAALAMMDGYDGHFVAGGQQAWVSETTRDDAWVLQDAWVREMMDLTFGDELTTAGIGIEFFDPSPRVLFNVLLRALAGSSAALPNTYDWFQDRSGTGLPTDPDELIVLALDNALADLGPAPWNVPRGTITYVHDILGDIGAPATPFGNRSTYAQCIEYDSTGPIRIESMFQLGQSGNILAGEFGLPVFDPAFFSMVEPFNTFTPRSFPLFD